ncbi:SAM-dependent methyltransferase [Aliikangiella maris]|uniref:SAM-dependent methyltransferase n=2 Tax=Aliikangiella maris TaxID=3162458 RepID=A0ABV3MMF0_9GAMM
MKNKKITSLLVSNESQFNRTSNLSSEISAKLANHHLTSNLFQYHSKRVTSNQNGLHKNLDVIVNKHIYHPYQRPIRQHNIVAFNLLYEKFSIGKLPQIILDSCCGTAMSTIALAEKNPDALVVGVDQSIYRLSKNRQSTLLPENCLLIQANCEDIWRLSVEYQLPITHHYIYYPNPWPKSVHLKRRWHGHPVFPYLQPLAKHTILRSNWLLYLAEFARAWELLTGLLFAVNEVSVIEPVTLFEKKYVNSGQAAYELVLSSS